MTVSSYKQVSIKDLFEFALFQAGGVKAEEIEKLLAGADEEKKRTIMKIIPAYFTLFHTVLPPRSGMPMKPRSSSLFRLLSVIRLLYVLPLSLL